MYGGCEGGLCKGGLAITKSFTLTGSKTFGGYVATMATARSTISKVCFLGLGPVPGVPLFLSTKQAVWQTKLKRPVCPGKWVLPMGGSHWRCRDGMGMYVVSNLSGFHYAP